MNSSSLPRRFRTSWRQARFQLRIAFARYRIATTDFGSGLGNSVWLLYGLARSLRPATCVEIGSATGWSACHVGLALRENVHGRLHAIDPHQPTDWNDPHAVDSLPVLRRNLRRCGVERQVEIVRATSEEAARGWKLPIDLIFIDGDHSYGGVRRDWELFAPHMAPFGVAVFHDTAWDLNGNGRPDMGVPRLVEELRIQGYPIITVNRDFGVTLVQAHRGGRSLASPHAT